jgi:hypothetical protein
MVETVEIDDELLTLVNKISIDTRSDKPQIRSKRPFGNSDYYHDVLRHTGNLDKYTNEYNEISDEGKEFVEEKLTDVRYALEILTQELNLEKGLYKKTDSEWALEEPH